MTGIDGWRTGWTLDGYLRSPVRQSVKAGKHDRTIRAVCRPGPGELPHITAPPGHRPTASGLLLRGRR